MQKLIVVIGMQRSGTTVLRELITANGSFIDKGEIFHAEFIGDPFRFFHFISKRSASDIQSIHPVHYSRVFPDFIREITQLVGRLVIDVKYNGLDFLDWGDRNKRFSVLEVLRNEGATFVHVCRRNRLRSILSEKIALKTGKWGRITDEFLSIEERRVYLPPTETVSEIERDTIYTDEVRRHLTDSEEIFYEEMFSENGNFSEKALLLASRLTNTDISRLNTGQVRLLKQNPESLGELILNYDEVANALQETRHRWMLHD